jgi:heavy-metal binding protein
MKKYQTHRVQNKTHTKFKLMRNKLFIVIALLVGLTSINAQERKANAKAGQSEVVYFIPNMHCERCQAKIEKAITLEKGVKDLIFDLKAQKLTIVYQKQETTPEKLRQALAKMGYEAKSDATTAQPQNSTRENRSCCRSK